MEASDLSWAADLDLGDLAFTDTDTDTTRRQQPDAVHDDFNEQLDFGYDDGWNDVSLFALDTIEEPHFTKEDVDLIAAVTSKKRAYDVVFGSEDVDENGDGDIGNTLSLQNVLPQLYPSLPLAPPHIATEVDNPFSNGSHGRYSAERNGFKLADDGGVNGYIKFRLREVQASELAPHTKNKAYREASMAVHHRSLPLMEQENVKHLPKDFGLSSKLNGTERKLFKFYTVAFCTGRTLITKSNFWLRDITAVADQDECVRHALLASTAAYVLDYLPNDQLRTQANLSYKRSVSLLGRTLNSPEFQVNGREIPLLTALLLIICDDIVNWELNEPRNMNPKWLQGTRIAKKVLDNTDPGYRYWKNCNVQSSFIRDALSNRVAFMDILSQPVSPLKLDESRRLYGWLLEGTAREAQRIRAGTGLCPKLLHMFAQTTNIAAMLADKPDSFVLISGADKIEQRLKMLHQWSELSDGFRNPKDLFDDCKLDGSGKVTTILKVTELTGEAWRATAQVYLHCRLFRKPRRHRDVTAAMDVLRGCIERMPYTGELFSSQAPFCPVFLLAMLSYRDEDRRVATEWFDTVVSGAGCRSSVPPIWDVIQRLRAWMATDFTEGEFTDETPISDRDPWWERLVAWLVEHEGILSLC